MTYLLSQFWKLKVQLLVISSWLFQYHAERPSWFGLATDPLAARSLFDVNGRLLYLLFVLFHTSKVRTRSRLYKVSQLLHWHDSLLKRSYFLSDFLQSCIHGIKHVINFIVDVLLVLLQVLFILGLDLLDGEAVPWT